MTDVQRGARFDFIKTSDNEDIYAAFNEEEVDYDIVLYWFMVRIISWGLEKRIKKAGGYIADVLDLYNSDDVPFTVVDKLEQSIGKDKPSQDKKVRALIKLYKD